MWRWSCGGSKTIRSNVVFSTYVEVILEPTGFQHNPWSILHVCGGDPKRVIATQTDIQYSPRMWRWSCINAKTLALTNVFSPYVEVIPTQSGMRITKSCILHVCGGDPGSLVAFEPGYKYSPRMWRWSRPQRKLCCLYGSILHVCGGDPKIRDLEDNNYVVFSTYVEVILPCFKRYSYYYRILHVCGGDP